MEIKINIEEISIGSELITWNNEKVVVLEIRTDCQLKPLVVCNKGKKEYYHFNQIEKIINGLA
jgi:hypothetical protein